MQKTVTVSEKRTQWDKHIRKDYPLIVKTLVSDPRDSLREGDVIQFSSGHPKSRRVSHVVERIVAPFGTPLDQRPAVMTAEEREGAVREKREKKDKKRMGRVEEWLKERVGEEEAGRILGSEGEREAVWEELRMGREKRLVRERLAAEGEAESGR